MRYKNIQDSKRNGVVYTPSDMASYISNLMFSYNSERKSSGKITVLDPAVGGGDLLIAMVNTLFNAGIKDIEVVGYETDEEVVKNTKDMLMSQFPFINVDIRIGDFLSEVEKGNVEKFDYVIANPPYIRTQILGSNRAKEMAEKIKVNGRFDIYYAFLIYTKLVMKDTGIAGYITSNKFMSIKAGESVRDYMLENYSLRHIIDLGDTKLFTASVLPCILIFSLGKTVDKNILFTSVYEEQSKSKEEVAENIFEILNCEGIFELKNGKKYKVKQGRIQNIDKKSIWGISTKEDEDFLSKVEKNTCMRFSDLGKIRVGIKTTADNVFIGNDWDNRGEKIELLRPLITHRNAGQFISNNENHWKVLYTHEIKDGKKKVIDIDEYPNSKAYLESNFEQLNSRQYLKKANRKWYEIWVPQNPKSWSVKKIIFREISEKPQFWFDETGAVVNGDCYWIDIKNNINIDLVYLALAIANSSFIEKYYDIRFNNKLYSGKRRFQSQYVEQFPIPNVSTDFAEDAIALVKKIIAANVYTDSDKEKIDKLVFNMFNI
ncbi:N-6 DNA methylase [Streptococcus parasanguinis]|uniref:N-6 DNA methylase n=1 Tax=Streptococcus parasanguinis TaxID=1318 RepID=UPI00352C1750